MAFGSITENSEERIEQYTREAIELADKGSIAVAVEKLAWCPTKLYGLRVRTASAVLCFYDPRKYPVVDTRFWKALYDEELMEDKPTPEEYRKYSEDVSSIAARCKMSMHEVDAALWVIGGGRT